MRIGGLLGWLGLAGLLGAALLVWPLPEAGRAQSGRRPVKSPPVVTSTPARQAERPPEAEPPADRPIADTTPTTVGDDGTIRLDTTLVSIPVSVLDRDGRFIPTLRKSDFRLYEDNVEQRIDSLQSVEVPFNVILAIDTSGSTRSRLDEIHRAAVSFVEELRAEDRVMILSFAGRHKVQCDFTSDRAVLREAIYKTNTGGGTSLYNAVDFALASLEKIEGRKALVLFTDGVDTTSMKSSATSTIARAEESGVLVYPVSYDTEDSIRGAGPGGRPPIFGPGWPMPLPGGGSRRRWPLGAGFQWPQGGIPPRGGSGGDYRRGRQYLQDLADVSGGRLYHAESIGSVSGAFSQIAEELRHQYSLSFYPSSSEGSGRFRSIRVRVTQPDCVVRTRRGYRR